MSNNIYAIDFGTCNFKVFSKSSGKIVTEKNTIAVINKNQIYPVKIKGDIVYTLRAKGVKDNFDVKAEVPASLPCGKVS